MPASDYYWSRHLIDGFGRMWFLIAPQEADSNGGGASLLGSVVNEVHREPFGNNFPVPEHLTTPQLILKTLQKHQTAIGLAGQELVQEVRYSSLNISVEKKDSLKAGVGNFPGLPISFSIDYSKMVSVSIQFGANTRKRFIPPGFLGKLKAFFDDDDTRIDPSGIIDRETIVHQILLADQYSITFESELVFGNEVEAAIETANSLNAGKINFGLDLSTRKKLSVTVNDGREYLIAIKDIDWDDF